MLMYCCVFYLYIYYFCFFFFFFFQAEDGIRDKLVTGVQTCALPICRAFGVGGITRQPGRLRISWQDDNTLKLEYDAGTQTRLLHFDRAVQPPAEKTWQGFSRADLEGPGVGRGAAPVGDARVTGGGLPGASGVPGGGGQGLRGGPPPRGQARI